MNKKPQNNQKPKSNIVTTTISIPKKEQRIFSTVDKSNIGILYWSQETLEKLTKLSGPLATNNEYQIHYWALVARSRFEDGSILDIAFPTAIFNYEQEVSGAHIDFELKDVKEVSEAIQPLHNVVTNNLIKQITEKLKDLPIEFLAVPMNTMHRHPTGVSSFSGTDLKKDHEKDTGIVFPLQSANEDASFSSIIYNNPVKMIHSEYRIASGSTEEKTGIRYKEGRCATYVKGKIIEPSFAEKVLGISTKDSSYLVTKDNELSALNIEELLSTIEYEPNVQFVKAENLKKKTYTSYVPYVHTGRSTGTSNTIVPGKFKAIETVINYTEALLRGCTYFRLKEIARMFDTAFKGTTSEKELENWFGYNQPKLTTYIIKVHRVAKKEIANVPVQKETTPGEQTLVYEPAKISEIKKVLNLDIENYVKLKAKTVHLLKLHCLPLERYYYVDDNLTLNEYLNWSQKDLIDHALELQDLVIDEFYNSPTDDIDDLIVPTQSANDYYDFMGAMLGFDDDETHLETFGFDDAIIIIKSQEEKIEALETAGVKPEVLKIACSNTIDRWYQDLVK
jgi:hypothetical protein